MFCRYCGAAIPEDSRFCPKCGQALEAPGAPARPAAEPQPVVPEAKPDPQPGQVSTAAQETPPAAKPSERQPEAVGFPSAPKFSGFSGKDGKNRTLMIALAAVGVIAVLAVGAALGGGKSDPPKESYAAQPAPKPSAAQSTPKPSAQPTETPSSQSAETPAATGGVFEQVEITYSDGRSYTGECIGGVPWGFGKMTYPADDSVNRLYYEGEWNNGVKKGQGTMVWTSGAVYEGQWENDRRHGLGVYTGDNGTVYAGDYKEGKRDGAFTAVTASGKTYDLVYENGTEVSRTERTGSGAPKVTPAPAGTDATKVTAKPASAKDADGKLPDPGDFLQCARYEDQADTSYGSDGHLVSYRFDMDDGKAAVEEFIELLQEERYHLKLRETKEEDYTKTSASKYVSYFFDYTGDETVGLIHSRTDGPTGNVYVLAAYYYGQNRIGLAFHYGSGFSLEDPVDRAAVLPEDLVGSGSSGGSSGSSSSSSGSSSGGKVTVRCVKCKGEGTVTCTECDGKGYKVSYESVPNYSGKGTTTKEVRTNCFKCKGSGEIECPRCHGSGES